MKKNTLLHTNLLVCTIITIGFIVTSFIGYRSNTDIFKRDAQHVSNLAAEGIYYQIDKILSKPINVSLTMANDNLLKSFLANEGHQLEEEAYIRELRDYLYAYREKYHYDSIFLVSTLTNRYYHFEGLDRILTPDNAENTWYYEFLKNGDEYSLNVDNDEATDNSITAFVNCKIKDKEGNILGVIGVGLKVDSLQALLKEYDENYDVNVCLIDQEGFVQVSSERTGYEKINFFEDKPWDDFKLSMLKKETTQQSFWYSLLSTRGYIVTQYIPNLKWHLLVQNDMTAMNHQLSIQLYRGIAIIGCIIIFVLIIITRVLKKYKTQIIMLSVSQEQEYQKLLYQTTEGLYENIFEFDITHNRAGGESTRNYFKELGLSPDASYDQALHTIVLQVKEEYVKGYLDTFSREPLLACYNRGITNLSYDLLFAKEGLTYHWMRISARIFYWSSDESIRVISYRTNIDAEKEREQHLLETSRRDSMTGLYNKVTTEKLVADVLERDQNTERTHAYLVFDIDDFKNINDKYGHTFGDIIIKEFSMEIQLQFRDSDIAGRIGGDEFAVLMMDYGDTATLCEKLERFCMKIATKNFEQKLEQAISISIGASLFPEHGTCYTTLFEKADEALYFAKAHGKNTFHVLGTTEQTNASSRLDARDIRNLLEQTTDGIAKYACASTLKLLYFNKRLEHLIGLEQDTTDLETVDPYSYVNPADLQRLQATLQTALPNKTPIDVCFQFRRMDGTYFPVRLRGLFVSERYQNRYPVFYAVYTVLPLS